MKNIVFWRISYSHHMDALFSEVRHLAPTAKVTVIYLGALRQERKNLGWPDKTTWHEDDLFQPTEAQLTQLIDCTTDPLSAHVFSGVLYHRSMRRAFIRTLSLPCQTLLLTEGREFEGAKGLLRFLQGWWLEGRRRSHINRVLAIGELAARNYRMLGLDTDRISPFSYVVEPATATPAALDSTAAERRLHFAIIGRLIPLKRVDLAIQALATLPCERWQLTVVGDGPERASLERLAASGGLESNSVRFTGVIPNADVKALLSGIDYLIFASNRDGWGAVVNESLMAGTPVICSRYPGASTLIHPGFNGMLFDTDKLDSLRRALDSCFQKGTTSESDRRRIAQWATCLYPSSLANYFLELLTSDSPPQAPWQTLA